MEDVGNQQAGSTLIRPLVATAVASVVVAALIASGTLTNLLPRDRTPAREDGPAVGRSAFKPGQPVPCALCGTIESVRSFEVYEEPGATVGLADSKNGPETASGGPGAAIAGGAVSMLESLNGAAPGGAADKNLRKRLVWRVTLHMDDGSFRAISLPSPPAFAVGDKVRVVEGRLVRA